MVAFIKPDLAAGPLLLFLSADTNQAGFADEIYSNVGVYRAPIPRTSLYAIASARGQALSGSSSAAWALLTVAHQSWSPLWVGKGRHVLVDGVQNGYLSDTPNEPVQYLGNVLSAASYLASGLFASVVLAWALTRRRRRSAASGPDRAAADSGEPQQLSS